MSGGLETLPFAEGASWDRDPNRTCLPGTRVKLLDIITAWIHSGNEERVFWLSSVAGAGKTALTNTIAQRCQEQGILASSFFFDHAVEGRNNPKKLFSTIARELAGFSINLKACITDAIDKDRSLVSASISRQFGDLILPCSSHYSDPRPVVIVIDALDEGCETALLTILRDETRKLSLRFRIIVTSRPEWQVVSFLSQQSHIRSETIDIHETSNTDDIALYARKKLKELALSHRHLSDDWPDEDLTLAFIAKAGGLFIWVDTVLRYLQRAVAPQKKLETLLSTCGGTVLPAEKQMDELYSIILEGCDWTDEDFVEGYRLFMGAIMALKSPISLEALQRLHGESAEIPAGEILERLASLLSGLHNAYQPIRTLHLSLNDFITARAHMSTKIERFYIDEKEHSQRLGLLCLLEMNKGFQAGFPGMGYSKSSGDGIPQMSSEIISDALWYACLFWIDHLMDINNPTPPLTTAMQVFTKNHAISWMEISASKGSFRSFLPVQKWLEVCVT